ncbi:MAG: preprotein translocase subunit SecA [Clostridia bacterium]|nr:preprotein translocase subunit SecA [Clostridia bacterium]
MGLFNKLFASYSEREINKIRHYVNDINALEPEMEQLKDEDFARKTAEFKERLANGETLNDILVEAYALAREGSKRVFGKRPFDVQLMGAIVLHQGRIAEMKTGEGKTLTAALALYLNALEGKGAHLVTVNDYLAKSQGEEMGKLYNFLGLSVGIIINGLDSTQRREAYYSDITYGTNNEFGFDYLRDNMAIYKQHMVQRDLNYAIVDEIDSILIDEARTPLIISGPSDKANDLYKTADRFVKSLKAKVITKDDTKQEESDEDKEYDYIVDLKSRRATLTSTGIKKAEKYFNVENLSDPDNMTLSHHINKALDANGVMKRDIDYIVKDDEVLIVDEHTGRIMYGRRYSDGLHQALEAKENVKIENENKTLATITFQNYFRLFTKLSGMTGTAKTEEDEFRDIYGLDVVEIPTNRPMIRVDHNDIVYKTERAKYRQVIEEIKESHTKGQPVLVGTTTVEKSEMLSSLLKKEGIKHEVLNAKYHEKEAEIVAQAGKYGAITIATNMAGRGTDIMLGGNTEALAKHELKKQGYEEDKILEAASLNDTEDPEILELRKEYRKIYEKLDVDVQKDREKVVEAGGLKIIGTERHDSRRIDNQLRGRSGRQGDIGESRFYVSLEDNLMKIFGGERIQYIADMINMDENMPLEAKALSSAIERAQKNVTSLHASARKNTLQYDDVMNEQRKIIYSERREVLDGKNLKENILTMLKNTIDATVDSYFGIETIDDDSVEEFLNYVRNTFAIDYDLDKNKDPEDIKEELKNMAIELYEAKEQEIGSDQFREIERIVLLRTVDSKWMDHIDDMEQLKEGVRLQGYAQKDPVVEFKMQSYDVFNEMTASIEETVVKTLLHIQKKNENMQRVNLVKNMVTNLNAAQNAGTEKAKPVTNSNKKVGRNDPCPCGSGKKYKKCHGANAE